MIPVEVVKSMVSGSVFNFGRRLLSLVRKPDGQRQRQQPLQQQQQQQIPILPVVLQSIKTDYYDLSV